MHRNLFSLIYNIVLLIRSWDSKTFRTFFDHTAQRFLQIYVICKVEKGISIIQVGIILLVLVVNTANAVNVVYSEGMQWLGQAAGIMITNEVPSDFVKSTASTTPAVSSVTTGSSSNHAFEQIASIQTKHLEMLTQQRVNGYITNIYGNLNILDPEDIQHMTEPELRMRIFHAIMHEPHRATWLVTERDQFASPGHDSTILYHNLISKANHASTPASRYLHAQVAIVFNAINGCSANNVLQDTFNEPIKFLKLCDILYKQMQSE